LPKKLSQRQNKILKHLGANKLDLALYSKCTKTKEDEDEEKMKDERFVSLQDRMKAAKILKEATEARINESETNLENKVQQLT
jgi:hypothetical protein